MNSIVCLCHQSYQADQLYVGIVEMEEGETSSPRKGTMHLNYNRNNQPSSWDQVNISSDETISVAIKNEQLCDQYKQNDQNRPHPNHNFPLTHSQTIRLFPRLNIPLARHQLLSLLTDST